MILPTFLTVLITILSLFTLATSLPVARLVTDITTPGANEPKSLLGYNYVRHTASPGENVPPTAVIPVQADSITRAGPLKRAARFQAAQRRQIATHSVGDKDLLSNQDLTPPAKTPTSDPSPSTQPQAVQQTPAVHNTSVTLIPRPMPTVPPARHTKGRVHRVVEKTKTQN